MDRLDLEELINQKISIILESLITPENVLNKKEILNYLLKTKAILLATSSFSYDEIYERLLADYLREISLVSRVVPGVSTAIKDNQKNIELYTYSGKVSKTGSNIDEKTRFDVASITKLFVATEALKLEEDGKFSLEKDVSSYKNGRYKYLQIPAILMAKFYYSLRTDGRIDEDGLSLDEIQRRLISTKIVKSKTFEYSDIPYIILKDILPDSDYYFKKYFYDIMGLWDTGYENFGITTGGNEYALNEVHDPKARKLRKFGIKTGHAGLFSTSYDLVKYFDNLVMGFLSKSSLDKLITPALSDPYLVEDGKLVYKKNGSVQNVNRALAAYISHPDGFSATEVSPLLSPRAFSITGFTGGYATFDLDNGITANILTNPLSNLEERVIPYDEVIGSEGIKHTEMWVKGRDIKILADDGTTDIPYYQLIQTLKEKQIELVLSLRLAKMVLGSDFLAKPKVLRR